MTKNAPNNYSFSEKTNVNVTRISTKGVFIAESVPVSPFSSAIFPILSKGKTFLGMDQRRRG
jgi:hypothetical protein